MKKLFTLFVVLVLVSGCTDATLSQITSLGKPFKVTLYSGGKEVGVWKSTGKVLTETHSDGWYFTDSKTGKLIRISGTVVLEEL